MRWNIRELLGQYATYIVGLLFYVAVFVFASFYFRLAINQWTLLIAFGSYHLILILYIVVRGDRWKARLAHVGLAALSTALIFLGLTSLFAKTYDISYDGMFYHEPAIIALADGWNPIYQQSPPLPGIGAFGSELVQGNPKVIWGVEASIYKLTGSMESAMSLNLLLDFVAVVFAYEALRQVSLGNKTSLLLALLAVATEVTIDQFFSLREDGISYDLLIVAISALTMIIIGGKHRPRYFPCLAAALVLLAGTKMTNAFVLVPVFSVAAYLSVKRRWYRQKAFHWSVAVGLLSAFMLLFNPYITNIFRYHAIDYPYSLPGVAEFSRRTNTPAALQSASRPKLFFYGIFSKVDSAGQQGIATNAHLKLPFYFDRTELKAEENTAAKTVGGYGILFSGLLIVSVVIYASSLARKDYVPKSKRWLNLALAMIILGCLLNPVPNYARYNAELELVPVFIIVATLVAQKSQPGSLRASRLWLQGFTVLVSLNALVGFLLVMTADGVNFLTLHRQLSALQSPHRTYLVHADTFYANYNFLAEHGVHIKTSPTALSCSDMESLAYTSQTTELCRQ